MEDTTVKNEYEQVARLVESMESIPNLTNQDKMNILLVYKGLKPATILEFVTPIGDEHANVEIAGYVESLCQLLQSQNFLVHKDCENENANRRDGGVVRDFDYYSVYTARTPENLSMLVESDTEEVKKLRKNNIKPFFIWKLEFSDVFKKKGGFDIIIGNPPYVGEKGNKEIFRPIAQGDLKRFYQGKMDLFYFFFHLALDLGKDKSQNAFITTNYYITALGAKKLRTDLNNRSVIRNLINFNELKIFESALGQHNIITLFSKEVDNASKVKTSITNRKCVANEKVLNDVLSGRDLETEYYLIEQQSLYDGNNNYIRVSGVSNSNISNNFINIILDKVIKNNITLGQICHINCGIQSGCNSVKIGNEKCGVYILDSKEKNNLNFQKKQKR